VLARVTLAGRPVGRRELAGELFGEADDPLGALRWSLADLRRSFGLPSLLCGDPLSLSPGELWVDVRALEDGSLPVEEIGGDLLGGIELRNCPGFDTWLLLARLDCAARGRQELRRRALSLLATGETEAAMAAAGRAAGLDPLDEDAQELLLRVLVAAGAVGWHRRIWRRARRYSRVRGLSHRRRCGPLLAILGWRRARGCGLWWSLRRCCRRDQLPWTRARSTPG
jgi:DNA-binding SARP family transcriptional activator